MTNSIRTAPEARVWDLAAVRMPYLGNLGLHKTLLPPSDPLVRLGTRDDKRKRNLAAVLVRHTNDTGIRYERIAEEMALEFGWSHLEATDFHNLLDALDDKNIVIGVDGGFIARADPSGNQQSQSMFMEGGVTIYPSMKVSLVLGGVNDCL